MKKFRLTEATSQLNNTTVYQIEALKDFGKIKKGQKGGYVQSEQNLSQEGLSWISGYACVYGNAFVCENAEVTGGALVMNNAVIKGNALVCEDSLVSGNAEVSGNAIVSGNSRVCDNAKVCDNANVTEKVCVYDESTVCGGAAIGGEYVIRGQSKISDINDLRIIEVSNGERKIDTITYIPSEKIYCMHYDYGDATYMLTLNPYISRQVMDAIKEYEDSLKGAKS